MNKIDFCVFLSSGRGLGDIDDIFDEIDIGDIGNHEALTHQASLNMLSRLFPEGLERSVKRLYFGNETCERLIPSPEDLMAACSICSKKGWGLSIVFPFTGPFGVDKIRSLVPVISDISKILGSVEVVVQDYGGLAVISDLNDPDVIPVLGRLFVRMKRDPRFKAEDVTTCSGDKELWEIEALRRFSLESAVLVDLLNKKGIRRAGFDALPQGVDASRIRGLSFDIYWPWIFVSGGKACKSAGLGNSFNSRHPVEKHCNKECQRMQIDPPKKEPFYSMLRGNSIWMESLELNKLSGRINRLIYQPYIPV